MKLDNIRFHWYKEFDIVFEIEIKRIMKMNEQKY